MQSKQWLNRHKKDPFVKNAQKKGYLSRASFKLLEIEKKFKLITKSKSVIEFGASPGGWSQVVINTNPNAKITAIDINEIKFNHPNLKFIKENFFDIDYKKLSKKFDLVLSDIAPNTTGHKSTDHLRIFQYINNIIDLLPLISNNKSSFVTKLWKGSEEIFLIKRLKQQFEEVKYFKPTSSRKDSSEIYIIATNYIY